MTNNIMLVGVGGQGTILASKILTEGLMSGGYDIKMSEIHGMSQRGGSVTSHVRYGKKIYSSVIEKGGADILVAFEQVEAMRYLPYVKKGGMIIVNDYSIESVTTIIGQEKYPREVISELRDKVGVVSIKASDIAKALGNNKVMNMVLLGSLVNLMSLEDIDWHRIIDENIHEKFTAINKIAFDSGKNNMVKDHKTSSVS